MPYDKIPYIYNEDEIVSAGKENVNHKHLERNIWYHTHDGINGSALDNVKISGSFTTDDILVKNKPENMLSYLTNYDSGWIAVDINDFSLEEAWENYDKDHYVYSKVIEHNLGTLPSIYFYHTSTNGGQKYTDDQPNDHNRYKYGSPREKGGQIGDITSETCKLKLGKFHIQHTKPLFYRVILIA